MHRREKSSIIVTQATAPLLFLPNTSLAFLKALTVFLSPLFEGVALLIPVVYKGQDRV